MCIPHETPLVERQFVFEGRVGKAVSIGGMLRQWWQLPEQKEGREMFERCLVRAKEESSHD